MRVHNQVRNDALGCERHILHGCYQSDDPFLTVPGCELVPKLRNPEVPDLNLRQLGDKSASTGTPTSFMDSNGSGEMTVLAEKLTLFPERLDLKRPSFPFSLCTSVFSGLPDLCLAGGIPLVWLSKYVVI